jgi:2-polyprenyl-3-methyl-5-hydroxy-6-metoxy-1,4-benzoquinol methylase
MSRTEGEIQVLASISQLEADGRRVDDLALNERGESYWIFKEDWTGVCELLVNKGLVQKSGEEWSLTDDGLPLGETYRAERVDMYWYYYQKFYTAAHASAAHSELCRRVFGADLTQEGQTDMASLNFALDQLPLGPGRTLLDLGCGAGVIAEYISDVTESSVVGIDYSSSAIAAANARTSEKRNRLTFETDNFNTMQPSVGKYDAILSMDTLYWVSDLTGMLDVLAKSLAPGGRMGLFMNHRVSNGGQATELQSDKSALGRAVESLGLTARVYDFTANLGAFWERNYAAALALKDQFDSEGNGFIAESLIRESEEDFLPEIYEGRLARYLFVIDAPT